MTMESKVKENLCNNSLLLYSKGERKKRKRKKSYLFLFAYHLAMLIN